MEILANFGERLKDLLFDSQLSAEQFAQTIGVSKNTVNCWLRGSMQISLANLILIADYFKCSLEYLSGKIELNDIFTPKPIQNFGTQLRAVLKLRGFTTYSLRKISRIDGGYFHKWDKGQQPNLATLIELSNILDCTIDYLVGRE